jgi:hypothetical protein
MIQRRLSPVFRDRKSRRAPAGSHCRCDSQTVRLLLIFHGEILGRWEHDYMLNVFGYFPMWNLISAMVVDAGIGSPGSTRRDAICGDYDIMIRIGAVKSCARAVLAALVLVLAGVASNARVLVGR